MIIEIKGDKLIVKEKSFSVKVSRKVLKSKKELEKEGDLYGKEGPCPPGEYYVFYRLRAGIDRLELTQEKPKELFTWNHKQGVLFSPKGTKRTNIQIHLGIKSKGCILISYKRKKEYFKLLKMVADALNKGETVKVIVDDYWKWLEKR